MKFATPALIALLQGNKRLPYANVFTLVTQAGADITALSAVALGNPVGETFFLTDLDCHVTVANHLFRADGPQISGLKYKLSRGLSVDAQKITIAATPAMLLAGQPALSAIAAGLLDGAEFTQARAFFDPASWPPAPGKPAVAVGMVNLFTGFVGQVTAVGRTFAEVEVRSELARLDVQAPRNLYQPSCLHTLFDAGCGLNRTLYQDAGVISGTSTRSAIVWANSRAADYYTQGTVRFTSGAAEGLNRVVDGHTTSGFNVIPPLPNAPAVGDSFIILPGCDHTLTGTNGCPKFLNQRNFRGFPYIPPPQTAF